MQKVQILKFPERKKLPADNLAIEYASRLLDGLKNGELIGFAAIAQRHDGSIASILTASCGSAVHKAMVASKLYDLAQTLAH